jgi:hypothetical protein
MTLTSIANPPENGCIKFMARRSVSIASEASTSYRALSHRPSKCIERLRRWRTARSYQIFHDAVQLLNRLHDDKLNLATYYSVDGKGTIYTRYNH